jgi:hypothetical protein
MSNVQEASDWWQADRREAMRQARRSERTSEQSESTDLWLADADDGLGERGAVLVDREGVVRVARVAAHVHEPARTRTHDN